MKLNFTRVSTVSVLLIVGFVLLLNWGDSNSGVDGGVAPLRLYCAAGMRRPVEKIIAQYTAEFGVGVETSFAGSGTLLSSMRAAGGDLYLAADIAYMDDARRFGLIREVAPIAWQSPVIAVRQGNPKNIQGLADLWRDDVQTSIASPEEAAISRVAKKALSGTGHWYAIWDAKHVARDTVNAVANDIKLASADAGIIWDATAKQYPDVEIVRVAEFDAAPNQIAIAVMQSSEQPAQVLHFLRYLTARDRGLKIFQELGFNVVDGDLWADRPEISLFSGGLNQPAVEETVRQFAQREGVTVNATYDGCGNLVGRMRTELVPDLFFSCDEPYMNQVEDWFDDARDVCQTEMVIIYHKNNADRLKINGLSDLARVGLKVGVCHPQQSALGARTKRLLDKHGLWEDVYKNVKDTPPTAHNLLQHVVIDSLDVAIVYKANTSEQAKNLVIVPIDDPDAHAVQPIAVSRESNHRYLATRLLEQIRSAESKATFERLDFQWLGESPAP